MAGPGGLSGAAIALITIDAMLSALLALFSGVVLFLIKRRSDRDTALQQTMTNLAGDVRSLREGMSVGAREAFTGLARRTDLAEDAIEQLQSITARDGERIAALDRAFEGHTRTNVGRAHPPDTWPPTQS